MLAEEMTKYSDYEVTEQEKIAKTAISQSCCDEFADVHKTSRKYIADTLKADWGYLLFIPFALAYALNTEGKMMNYIGGAIFIICCVVVFLCLRKTYKKLSKGRITPETQIATGRIIDIFDSAEKSAEGVEYMEFFAEIAFESERKLIKSAKITNRAAKYVQIGDEVIVTDENVYVRIDGKWDK